MRCCHSTHSLLFSGSAGVTRGGQQQNRGLRSSAAGKRRKCRKVREFSLGGFCSASSLESRGFFVVDKGETITNSRRDKKPGVCLSKQKRKDISAFRNSGCCGRKRGKCRKRGFLSMPTKIGV